MGELGVRRSDAQRLNPPHTSAGWWAMALYKKRGGVPINFRLILDGTRARRRPLRFDEIPSHSFLHIRPIPKNAPLSYRMALFSSRWAPQVANFFTPFCNFGIQDEIKRFKTHTHKYQNITSKSLFWSPEWHPKRRRRVENFAALSAQSAS